MGVADTNYFDQLLLRLRDQGASPAVAVERVATAYVDGKPVTAGNRKPSKKERDILFWSSNAARICPAESWNSDAMVLALARYLGQKAVVAAAIPRQSNNIRS
jgi:hypothetical protein